MASVMILFYPIVQAQIRREKQAARFEKLKREVAEISSGQSSSKHHRNMAKPVPMKRKKSRS